MLSKRSDGTERVEWYLPWRLLSFVEIPQPSLPVVQPLFRMGDKSILIGYSSGFQLLKTTFLQIGHLVFPLLLAEFRGPLEFRQRVL